MSVPVLAAQAQDGGSSHEFRYLMGTSVGIEAHGGDAERRRAAIEEAFGAIAEVDRLMSNYRDDSELARINRDASREAVPVGDAMLGVLQAAEQVSRKSQGAFDITVGPLMRLWGFHDKKPHLPTESELAAVRPLVDYRNLAIDAGQHTIRFTRPGVELDLGGIAKGFAVELAAGVLRRAGMTGFIDAGGNEYFLGTPPGKSAWTVGVTDPDHADRLLGVIDCAEGSVSTSADYSNFLTVNGRRYGHVLNPHTLYPSDAALSVTVLSRDGTMADAVSKAAFILGPKEGLALVDSYPGMSALIAYRSSSGVVSLALSDRLKPAFHPVRRTDLPTR
jgi:thiamine biosynthesis lipoprotein